MKILIINGSPRKHGISSQMIEALRESIHPSHTVEFCEVHTLAVKPCRGCLKCRPDGVCVLPRDGAHVFGEMIANADVIMIAAPTFWGNMPGPLKTLFDRNVTTFEIVDGHAEKSLLNRIPIPRLKGKKAAIIVSSATPFPFNLLANAGAGAGNAIQMILKGGGIKIVKTLNIPDGYRFDRIKGKYFRKIKAVARRLGVS